MRHRSAAPTRSVPRVVARLGLGAVVSTVVTGLVLAVPVVSGAESGTPSEVVSSSTSATSSSSSSPTRETSSDSPVIMGVDGGAPTAASAEGGSPSETTPAAPGTTSAAPAPATTAAAPAAPPAPAAVEAPVAAAEAPDVEEAAAPAPSSAPAAAPAASDVEGQVLALVNTRRAAEGCGALVADEDLAAVARAHSADMRDQGYFDHVDRGGRDPFDRAAAAGVEARAENIAKGQRDAAAVVADWMDSPGHRKNILDCSLTSLGVGVAEGPGGPWWTQLFA